MERLGQEALNLAGAAHDELVFFRKFVHAQNGNHILKVLVALQHHLHATRHFIMLIPHNFRGQGLGSGRQRFHRREEPLGRQRAFQHHRGVQVGEGCGRGRVRQVVRRNIHGLHGGDGAVLGGGDAFLKIRHFLRQVRLVTHGGRRAAQQGGHFRPRLGETENIVNEQQHVLMLLVTEVFRHRQGGQGYAQTGAGGFIHLSVHQRHLGFFRFLQVDDSGFYHLIVQVVPLTGAFPHPGKNGEAAARLGNVVDQLHDEHGLAYPRTPKGTDFAAFQEGADKVNYLDARFQHFRAGGLFVQRRSAAVDALHTGAGESAALVHSFPQHIENTSQHALPHRHFNRAPRVAHRHPPPQTVRRTHGHGADPAVSDVLLDFQNQGLALAVNFIVHFQRIEQGGERFCLGEVRIDHSADDLNENACVIHHGKNLVLKWRGKNVLFEKRVKKAEPCYSIARIAVVISRSSLVICVWRALL